MFLLGCNHVAKIPDFSVCTGLPYSKKGYCIRVISQQVREIEPEQWVKERRAMVCMPPASYTMIKNEFYRACYSAECEQALDSIGEIFDVIDNAASIYNKLSGKK